MSSNLIIEVELLSEAIFGSGEAVPGYIDLEVLHDEYGLPYLKGKTFKGNLRKSVEGLGKILMKSEIKESIDDLFGTSYSQNESILKFSDCSVNEEVKSYIAYGICENYFTAQEVLASLTDIRYFTRMNENGVSQDGSLREFRVINRGLIFETIVESSRELTQWEKGLLACGVSAVRELGVMKSRGKGEIEARLLEDGIDVTKKYIDSFVKGVSK